MKNIIIGALYLLAAIQLVAGKYDELITQDPTYKNFEVDMCGVDDLDSQLAIVQEAVLQRERYAAQLESSNSAILLRGLSELLSGHSFAQQKPEYAGAIDGCKQYLLRFNSVAPELQTIDGMPYIGAGHVLVYLKHKSKIYLLVVKDRSKEVAWLPGGTKNRNEEHLWQTARRELLEEGRLDIDSSKLHLVGIVNSQSSLFGIENVPDIDHIFYATVDVSKLPETHSIQKLFHTEPVDGNYSLDLVGNDEVDFIAAIELPQNCKSDSCTISKGHLHHVVLNAFADNMSKTIRGFKIPQAVRVMGYEGLLNFKIIKDVSKEDKYDYFGYPGHFSFSNIPQKVNVSTQQFNIFKVKLMRAKTGLSDGELMSLSRPMANLRSTVVHALSALLLLIPSVSNVKFANSLVIPLVFSNALLALESMGMY